MVCGCILHGGTQSIITGLPRAQTLTIMKQCGIILTANGTRGSQHPKNRALEDLLRCLENYFWRLLQDVSGKLAKRVQAKLKNKGGHIKYWFLSLLELLDKLFLPSIKRISFYMFNNLLHLFPILWGGSRLIRVLYKLFPTYNFNAVL